MQDQKGLSQFEFLVFNSISHNDSQIDKTHLAFLTEGIGQGDDFPEQSSCSDVDSESDSDCYATPEIGKKNDLSSVLTKIKVSKNPLSTIGDPSEKQLLKITNSPNVGAMTEVRYI